MDLAFLPSDSALEPLSDLSQIQEVGCGVGWVEGGSFGDSNAVVNRGWNKTVP